MIHTQNDKGENTMKVQLSAAGIAALKHINCMHVPDVPNVSDEQYILLMADGICLWASPREVAAVLFPEVN